MLDIVIDCTFYPGKKGVRKDPVVCVNFDQGIRALTLHSGAVDILYLGLLPMHGEETFTGVDVLIFLMNFLEHWPNKVVCILDDCRDKTRIQDMWGALRKFKGDR